MVQGWMILWLWFWLLLLLLFLLMILVKVVVSRTGAVCTTLVFFLGRGCRSVGLMRHCTACGTAHLAFSTIGAVGFVVVVIVAAAAAAAASRGGLVLFHGSSLLPLSVVQDSPIGVVLGAVSVGLAISVGSLVLLDTALQKVLALAVTEIVPKITTVDIPTRGPFVLTILPVHLPTTEGTLVDIPIDKSQLAALLAMWNTSHHVSCIPTDTVSTLHSPFHLVHPNGLLGPGSWRCSNNRGCMPDSRLLIVFVDVFIHGCHGGGGRTVTRTLTSLCRMVRAGGRCRLLLFLLLDN
mmetsp:Transcript_1086/g.1981  ORF Transcript_1086/g.1981 Transcript_1086/m.1981 type:complete len:294 (-) Transcript_1086:269-1150(-)